MVHDLKVDYPKRRYMKLRRDNGQIRTKTRPTILFFAITPNTRESFELPRLSPITQ